MQRPRKRLKNPHIGAEIDDRESVQRCRDGSPIFSVSPEGVFDNLTAFKRLLQVKFERGGEGIFMAAAPAPTLIRAVETPRS